ncbi:unnamed protein product [Anisakis simplex]|uniref:DUF659 domain-containing protein n=1 Tax=Anisakis simplex TaxID=6269 RepID=A0A0M3K231_ANISI|nr:unnamed protein product [Anisakis simplex]
MDYYKAAKSNVIEEIKNLIRNGEKFSVTLDEYLSIRNKRYLIVNLRALEKLYCLGTITITGSVSTERVTEILVEKMEEFEINLKTDIIAVVSDGDSAMVTLGQNIDALHLLCLAHGMHLAVCDVLYYNQKKLDECENSDDDEEPTETDEEYAEFKMDLVKKANHFPVMYQRHIKLMPTWYETVRRDGHL